MKYNAEAIIDALNSLRGDRAQLNELWQEVSEVLAPERMGFTRGSLTRSKRRMQKVFDTTPMIAQRGLVNALGAMMRPKSAAPGKWFDIVPDDEDLLDDGETKSWLSMCEERLWKALYNPKARFIEATGEIDGDIVTFGSGVGYVGVRPDMSGLMFRAFHMANVYVEVDSLNQPECYYVIERLTVKQAAGRFGEENLGRELQDLLRKSQDNRGRSQEKHEFIWKTGPRHERNPALENQENMPFYSVVVDVTSKHIVQTGGFQQMPFFFPRWDTRSGETYGRGPGVLALPDTLTLQQMGKTMLRGLHRAVDPPWLLPSDSMVNAPQLRPGGVSYYDARAIRNLGMSQPFQQMDSRAQIPWGLDAQQMGREQIFAMFYRNVLNLPVQGPQMTATEVIQRREEFVREIGAVFGRLESDYTGPMVETAFNIMLENGGFGPVKEIPEALQGSDVTFRFASPVEKAKRQIEEATVSESIQKVLAIGQVKPEIMDRFDWDAIGKFIAEAADFPPELTLDDSAMDALQQQRQQQAAMEAGMQTAERLAGAAGSAAPAMAAMQGMEDTEMAEA